MVVGELTVLALVALLVTGSCAQADSMHVLALATTVTDVLNNIRDWVTGILGLIATVLLTIGGVRYTLAGGDPGEIEKAKQALKSAGWGYGLAMLAPVLLTVLNQFIGQS